ncbi:TIGR03016 family PEP-CTERM system-associated outer membrane protein [Geobacter sp. FeAm09]|uniref:TIGR03016 family PEP-CTERM system-associated outer membrane protein n=1 Tax=Geobacter sp. FeAm09 TaxID=2597769 RepID=UPI0011ECFD9C|nr:TIGR03016 family PEP-CTERM system-associated outer membrane protein [Geobacter sp. FeAm09]QEM68671.1 TIGR03016 family PEP-CTERM system-associated outer membrane protein [Geobacter sp. FeAm09]
MMNRFRQTGMIGALIATGLFTGISGQACASELDFKPSLAVIGEINDNIYESASGKRTDYITRVQPGATLHYLTPFWNWDVAYTFDYRNYARHSRDDEYNHDANLKGTMALVDNFFYLDVSDTYRRVSLDVSRDVTTQSSLFVNQTDQNIAMVSPYLLWRPGAKSTLKTGYRYTDTRYWDSDGIDKHEHGGFADLTYELTPKLSLTLGYAFTRSETVPVNFDKHDVYGGFKYQYAEKSFVFGQIGNTWQNFRHYNSVNYLFWHAGVTHDFEVAVATLETNVQNTEDPLAVSTKETSYSGKLDKVLQRGAVGISSSYSEYVNTQTDTRNQRKLSFSGYGRHEVVESLTASLNATAERYYQNGLRGEYPYHFIATGSLAYAFNHDITLTLTYSYETNRDDINSSTNARDINRGIVEIRKIF